MEGRRETRKEIGEKEERRYKRQRERREER
jgi:hypothetical protein